MARDIEVDDTALFMWMGCCALDGEIKVHLYKHIGTRRYVNLDTAGHAYRYRLEAGVGVYETITSPTVALAEVLDVAGEAARDSIDRWSMPGGRPAVAVARVVAVTNCRRDPGSGSPFSELEGTRGRRLTSERTTQPCGRRVLSSRDIGHPPQPGTPEVLGSGPTGRPRLSGGSRAPSSRRSRTGRRGVIGD